MNCRLCEGTGPLRRSHILPEFLYESMYDVKHRFQVLSIIPSQENKLRQKGLYEELLCDQCEQRFSTWERYASLVLKGGISLNARREGNLWHVSGIDYVQFKLFQLSILWRAGVSGLQFFENVDLGPHEERIRHLLLNGNPGPPTAYGCMMFGLKFQGKALTDMMIQPRRFRLQGQVAYRFIFGGFLWAYLVSNQPLSAPFKEVFLQPSGSAIFLVKDAETAQHLIGFGQELLRLGRM